MKKSLRIIGIIFCLVVVSVFFQTAASASNAIDVTTASEGYFTVNYSGTSSRMKVGVTVNGETKYSDYTAGTEGRYAFSEGDGEYSIRLYRNTSGTSYKKVASAEVKVTLNKANVQYLASTSEISFSADGAVAKKASEICKGKKTAAEKATAIYKFMLDFSYDYELAGKITRGEIVGYTPDTAAILSSKKGICYDFSALYAAMCRSQGIPCKLVKGTLNNGNHAWNEVYCGGRWLRIDMTYSIQRGVSSNSISGCVTHLNGYVAK